MAGSLSTGDVAAREELAARLREAKDWHGRVSTGPHDGDGERICSGGGRGAILNYDGRIGKAMQFK